LAADITQMVSHLDTLRSAVDKAAVGGSINQPSRRPEAVQLSRGL
jgi:hypothetical protein